jgi:hypothetical protein
MKLKLITALLVFSAFLGGCAIDSTGGHPSCRGQSANEDCYGGPP